MPFREPRDGGRGGGGGGRDRDRGYGGRDSGRDGRDGGYGGYGGGGGGGGGRSRYRRSDQASRQNEISILQSQLVAPLARYQGTRHQVQWFWNGAHTEPQQTPPIEALLVLLSCEEHLVALCLSCANHSFF